MSYSRSTGHKGKESEVCFSYQLMSLECDSHYMETLLSFAIFSVTTQNKAKVVWSSFDKSIDILCNFEFRFN